MIEVSNLYYDRYGTSFDKDFSTIDVSHLMNSILSRASVRKFSKKNIPHELLTLLLTAAQSAPSKSNLQQYSILVIQNKALKKEISNLIGKMLFYLLTKKLLLIFGLIHLKIKLEMKFWIH